MLGYHYCRLTIQFNQLDPHTRKQFNDYVFSHPNLFWAFELGGEYDFLLVFWLASLAEFEGIVKDFKAQFGPALLRKSEQVVTNAIHLQHKFLGPKSPRRFDLKETTEQIDLDETDRKILRELSLDARLPLVRIAQKTGLAPKMVGYRIRRMRDSNFIAGYRPILNYEKLGLTYYKVFMNLAQHSGSGPADFEKYLIGHPMVLFVVKGIAIPSDTDFELLAESNQAFFDFIAETKNRFPGLVGDYKYLIYTKTLKVNYLPFA
jgi:DNA-binding Lrp family transcriptional regulator